jgi:class 3 adenylate cyclase
MPAIPGVVDSLTRERSWNAKSRRTREVTEGSAPTRVVAQSNQPSYDRVAVGRLLTGERVARRLAAILAADVVGYSRLKGRDESSRRDHSHRR